MPETDTELAARVQKLQERVIRLEQARLAPYLFVCGVIDQIWLFALKSKKAFIDIKIFLGLDKT